MNARFWRRHTEYAQERRQTNGVPGPLCSDAIELPPEGMRRLGVRRAPRSWPHLVDMNGERLAGTRAVYRYRPDERMARIDRGIARHELLTGLEEPAGARDCEA